MRLLILEREKGGERGRERHAHISVREKHLLVASCMRPDQESNPQPFGVWDDTETN